MSEKCTCGHTRAAHTSTKCSVCICSCRGFTVPADSPPQTLVVEQQQEQVCNHSAGFSNVSGLLACSTCGTPYSSIDPAPRAGRSHLLGEDGTEVLGLDDDPHEAGSLVVHAGEIKAGEVAGSTLRCDPPVLATSLTALQKRIYDAIDEGWQGYEDFDPTQAMPAVQALLGDLLDELELSDLADEVRAHGGWVRDSIQSTRQ